MNLQPQNQQQVLREWRLDGYAYWTRDGKFVYFNSDRSGISKVYRIAMDGLDCFKGDVQPV